MSENVIGFPGVRELDGRPRQRTCLPSRVLKDALSTADELETCLVIGLLKDGSIYAADTQEHFADTLLIMERFKQSLMSNYSDDSLTSDHPPGTSA